MGAEDWKKNELARLNAGILIGGQSRRMGTAKHLLRHAGQIVVEYIASVLRPHVERVLLLGAAELPAALASWPRLDDAEGVSGPLAGVLAALRWNRERAWLLVACDMPCIDAAAVEWLVSQRTADTLAILPRGEEKQIHPLLAIYEPGALDALEDIAKGPNPAPRKLAQSEHVRTPVIPDRVARAWINVNTPEDLENLMSM